MSELNAKERIAALSPEKRELLLKKLAEKQKSETMESLPKIDIDMYKEDKYLPFEFTEVQQVYWMGQSGLFDLSSCSTNIYSEYEVSGLNGITRKAFAKRLERALNLLIKRHDMLRLVVLPEGDQKILKEVPQYQVKCEDLRGKSVELVKGELDRVRNEMRTRKAEINQWPLFELRIHYVDVNRTILHIQLNALLVDGTSRGMFINELFRLTNKPSAVLPKLECSYRDYAVTWSKFKNSSTYKKHREHWLKKLPELMPGPVLPLSRSMDMEEGIQSEILHVELFDKESWSSFSSYSSKFALSGSSALLGAYADLIAFYSSTKKFSLGVINTYRPPIHPKIDNILGNFNTMQIIDVDILQGSFIERTEKLQQQVLYNIEHPYFSGLEVLREFNRAYMRSSKTSLPVFFNSVLSHVNNQSTNHSIIKTISRSKKKSTFNKGKEFLIDGIKKAFLAAARFLGITLDIRQGEVEIYPSLMQLIPTILEDRNGSIICKWQGVRNLFPEGMLKEMVEDYRQLLKRLSEREEYWHCSWGESISKLNKAEQHVETDKDKTINLDANLNNLFSSQAVKADERAAIITSERAVSYCELYRDSNKIANLLLKNGVKDNAIVGVMLEKSWEEIAVILGIMEAGAAFVSLDIAMSNQELLNLLHIINSGIVITNSCIAEKLEYPDNIKLICLDNMDLREFDEKYIKVSHKPEDLACVVYNVCDIAGLKLKKINHSMISNVIIDLNRRLGVTSEDKLLSLYPSVSEQWLYDVFGMLTAGGTIVLPTDKKQKNFLAWSSIMQKEKVTIWNSSPILFEELVTFLEKKPGNKLNSLKLLLLSNGRIPGKLLKRAGNVIGQASVVHLWGAYESPIWSMMHVLKSEEDMEAMTFDEVLGGHDVFILNEAIQQCPKWTTGNIFIGGKHLEAINNIPDSSREVHMVQYDGKPLLRTKYIGRYTEKGYIEVAGEEQDFKASLRGYFIMPHHIEREIEQHPEVRLSIVRTEEGSDQKTQLTAYLVTREESTTGIDEIREFLKEKLPYYLIPTNFVIIHSLPLNIDGSIDTKGLTALLSSYMEKPADAISENAVEARLMDIWKRVLHRDNILKNDNFFDLGGDSLKILKMSCLIEKDFGKRISAADFFTDPTIEQLACALS